MRLQKLSDFVIEQEKKVPRKDNLKSIVAQLALCEFAYKVLSYAKFLQTPITIGMFVPCVDGKPVEEPNRSTHTNEECEAYQKAKEAVLFENIIIDEKHLLGKVYKYITRKNGNDYIYSESVFEKGTWVLDSKLKTIEDLIPYNLTLTPSAVKNVLGL